MPEEPEEGGTNVEIKGGPGCGWALIVLILCVTAYDIAELYFAHKH